MATVIKYPTGRYWIAAFRDSRGRQHRRTTREVDKKRARAVAEQFERVAKRKGNPQRVRRILSEFYREHYEQDLPFTTVRAYAANWLAIRKVETTPATHRRYGDTILEVSRLPWLVCGSRARGNYQRADLGVPRRASCRERHADRQFGPEDRSFDLPFCAPRWLSLSRPRGKYQDGKNPRSLQDDAPSRSTSCARSSPLPIPNGRA